MDRIVAFLEAIDRPTPSYPTILDQGDFTLTALSNKI